MASSNISDEYDALEVIGKGSFGTVRKVRQRSDGQLLVRKEIEYTSMNVHERNQLILELRILRELNHPNIVKYYRHDHIVESKCIHIYMEFCDGGDLAQVITNFRKNKEQVPEEFIWQVLVQTLLALHRCHYGIDAKKVNLFSSTSKDEPPIDSETVVIHRDIKPDNIFMLNDGKSIKLGDFGLAKMLTSQNDFAKTYVGTPYYMSPEVLVDNPYSPVCDIWSLGCVLYELCTLQPPFQAKTHLQLQAKIKRGVIPELPDTYSNQLCNIIRECITVDVNLRPSCYELLETLSIRFLRKEMELKEISANLNEFQKQLLTKNDELKKKENYLNTLDRKVLRQREELQEEYNNIQKKCNAQKKQLEDELVEEFELRKRAMDLEAKEVRLGYQREFKMVVEQEVQQRLKEYLNKQLMDIHRKKSDPTPPKAASTPPPPMGVATPQARTFLHEAPKPRGPRELVEEPLRRSPLKTRNDDFEYFKASPTRGVNNYKKRVTDELERLSLEKRHIPEYEEVYMRKHRHAP
ncbi:kinase-like protein [Suhomyces tanzawaensis NRRL Y-17324]|uniref:non-specific serine/threonine protein kinase n=1 Tax=Suhomyces tanzawaensis NRRL Y-17324 TaxID=984487 RepID=A0A1E4SJP9_9ASCO|nr:kinase-like protein [Suhomyces tanzawaensis NRRL Y-17324]ODV79733.1 kinase-like protein [Suhomyces tanzawaensis NRRL Y-17324]